MFISKKNLTFSFIHTAATQMNEGHSTQKGSPVFGPLTNHKAVAVKCILGSHRNCQGAVLKTNHGGHQGASRILLIKYPFTCTVLHHRI